MPVSVVLAIIGCVILIGFFANLLFRITKIPSVLLLIAIGVILGPATGWVTSDALIKIAPFFGTLALLVILFQGGLELDIESVLKQAPRAAVLALAVFLFSVVSVAAFAFYLLHLPLLPSMLLAAILGANSPAICIPIVSGLSVRKEIKTMLKLESALGDVLLIVTVLFMFDLQISGNHGVGGIISSFFMSFAVAFAISLAAGALWSRLIGWMGKEPLAYMLTLGFVLLLYFGVEALHGSAALAVLMFGMMLENMHAIAGRVGERVRNLFGIDVRAEQFVLDEFMKNITEELSFLIRTFFFVYLGLLLDFSAVTPAVALSGASVVILLLISRWLAVRIIKKSSQLNSTEMHFVVAMLPRGLATAVMAFLAVQRGMAGADFYPIYSFIAIVLTNVLMTGMVVFAERRQVRDKITGASILGIYRENAVAEQAVPETAYSGIPAAGSEDYMTDALSVAAEAGHETPPPAPASFTAYMSKLFGIRPRERELRYLEAIETSSLAHPPFWVQVFLAAVLTALGLVLNQSAIIIGAALIVPIAWPVLAAGLALAVGDILLFLKLLLKLFLVAAMVAVLCAVFSELLPFNAVTAEIAARTKPTILDFLVALFAGMAGAVLLFSKKTMLYYFPGAILALTLLPPLAVLGFGFGSEYSTEIFYGAALLFTANFFAAILGASLIYASVGMPETAALKGIRVWKRETLHHPFEKFILDSPTLRSIIGRAGSVRSRLIVVAVFLLALVIPLQMAFNQLNLEFRARQAISDVERMFDVAGRSAIINSTSNIGEDAITVRIQVATNSFFTSSDIEGFEQRIADRTGKPTRLNLVQSLSDIGEGAKIRGILSQSAPAQMEYKQGIYEIAAALRAEIDKSLQSVPLPPSMTILGTRAEFGPNQAAPSFRIEYLAESQLSEDGRLLLAALLERRMEVKADSLRFTHIPAQCSLLLNSSWQLREEEKLKLAEIQDRLTQYPQLHAHVRIPSAIKERPAEKLKQTLYRLAPLLADSSRSTMSLDSTLSRGFTITLESVSASAMSAP